MATYQIETEGGHVYQVETADEQGALESAARGAGNNFPLAPQAIAALSSGDYSKNLADWKQKAEEGKAQHPVAYGAGAVAGAAAPLLIPGVGEALEAAPIATNAALGAASAINDTDLSKSPDEALKQAAIGGTVGGVVGKLGDVASDAADTVGQYATRFGENQAVKGLGRMPPGMMPDEARELARRATEDYGLLDVGTGPIGREKNVAFMKDQAGREIGDIRESASADGPLMTGEQMADAIKARLQDKYAVGGANFKDVNAMEQELQNIRSMKSTTPADFAERATAMKQDAAGNRFMLPTNAQVDVANAMSHINDEGIAGRLPDMAEHYGQLNQTYGDMMGLGRAIELGERRNLNSRGNHTLFEAGTKFVDELGAHKAGARLGMGIGDALQGDAGRKLLSAGTVGGTAGITSTILSHLQSDPQSLGKFAKPLAQAASSGGPQGIAATHFVLSQTYPEYNALWQDRADHSASTKP